MLIIIFENVKLQLKVGWLGAVPGGGGAVPGGGLY